jgi:hypothetical protein
VELTRDVDQAIAVVGQGDDELAATLTSIAATLSRGMPEGSRLIVLDGEPADRTAWLAPIIEDAERRGITVERVDRSGVAAYLLERLLPELPVTSGPTTLVLGLGLQRIPDLNDEHLVDPEDPYGDRISAALVLSRLATRGAIGGRFFVGHWSNARTLTETLGHNHDGIGVYALLSVGLDEFRDILGPYATKPEGSPRVTLFDRRTGGAERTVVPFEPGGMP